MLSFPIPFEDFEQKKQGNQKDVRKIHVTRQFFGAIGPQGPFFEKTKKNVLDIVKGSVCIPNFKPVSFSFGHELTYRQKGQPPNIRVNK